MLYNALFLSFVQYGVIVWGQTFVSYLEPIFKLQKRAVRAKAVARDGRVGGGGVAINFADRRAWFWVWLLLSSLRRKKI